MTLDEALTESRRRPGTDTLAVWVRETLGEDALCGYPDAIVYDGLLTVGAGRVTPAELRALCAMWLRAADLAEAEQ